MAAGTLGMFVIGDREGVLAVNFLAIAKLGEHLWPIDAEPQPCTHPLNTIGANSTGDILSIVAIQANSNDSKLPPRSLKLLGPPDYFWIMLLAAYRSYRKSGEKFKDAWVSPKQQHMPLDDQK